MRKTNIWRRFGAVLLAGVLAAGMSVTGFSRDVKMVHASDNSPNNVSGGNGGSCSTETSKDPGAAAVERLTATVELQVASAVEAALAQAVEAGITPEEAKANTVVKLNGKYLGTNMFSVNTMQKFQDAGIDIAFSYDYDGNHYEILMPAGEIPIVDDVPWYGPLYLAELFRDYLVITPIEAAE